MSEVIIMNLIKLYLILYQINKLCTSEPTKIKSDLIHERTKRFLIVPPTAPTRHQLIWGIGIPVGLEDESVTSGWVLKAQYFLPTSVNDLKPQLFFGMMNKRGQRSTEENNDSNGNQTYYVDPVSGSKVEHYSEQVKVIETKPIQMEDNEETEIDYMDDIVWRENYKNDNQVKEKNSRWMIYRLIEGIAKNKGLDGRACLLRTICEASDAKFSHKSGLMGELLHVVLALVNCL